ncbi:GntP family permease [Legionella rowbothamii]|uniref:GntP family permease n=1 Tax=Legionella rowbothamii TaxID=96229 RepID=UPI00105656AD|nr:GntP family permease [Legionella rowbothamii]
MGLLGILVGLTLLIVLAFRGWSILLLAPGAALIATLISGEPLLAHWTQTFMNGAARFIAQFFPLFLLGALFGKLMEDSGSVSTIANFMTQRLGTKHALLAVVLAGALATYGGVSLFVVFFVLAPMAQSLFKAAVIPRRLMPAAIVLGTSTFTMSALPGTPSIQNAIPMPFFGTTLFAAPGLGIIASAVILAFGMWWLKRAEADAKHKNEPFGEGVLAEVDSIVNDQLIRGRATADHEFDTAEITHGRHSNSTPTITLAFLPMFIVISVNFVMALLILPHFDFSFLAKKEWGATSFSEVGGIWSILIALTSAIFALIVLNRKRFPSLRETMDAGANASVLPVLTVASLVGFGAVIAALPAFAVVRNWVLELGGGPLVSVAAATNILSAITGSASGGLSIALESLGSTYLNMAQQYGIEPALLHRVAVISSGILDTLPHNGAIVTLLAVCQVTHRQSYWDIIIVGIVGPALALGVVIFLGARFGSF